MKEGNDNEIRKRNQKYEINSTFLEKMDNMGMDYIIKKKNYLVLSAIFPIFLILTQSLNLVFINLLRLRPPPNIVRPPGPLDLFTPIIILFVISFFALLNYFFLVMWKDKIRALIPTRNKTIIIDDIKPRAKQRTLTATFYEIIDNMKIIRVVFVLVNVISLYYFIWAIYFFLISPPLQRPPLPLPFDIFHRIIEVMNTISAGELVAFLVYEWMHVIRWSRKLAKLQKLEKKIFLELNP